MSRLTDLISQVKANDPELGNELEREFKTLASRRSFGLNFERHLPESVELPGRPVRKGGSAVRCKLYGSGLSGMDHRGNGVTEALEIANMENLWHGYATGEFARSRWYQLAHLEADSAK